MKITLECLYCGHKWDEYVYSKTLSAKECPKCNDTNLKAREHETVDLYAGAPAFPEDQAILSDE